MKNRDSNPDNHFSSLTEKFSFSLGGIFPHFISMTAKNRSETSPLGTLQWGPVLFFLVTLMLWLAPFFWSGWKGRTWSWLPSSLTFQHTAAGLFTQRSTRWWEHHLEGTVGQGAQAQQVELDEWKVFPMGAFGYRTRYDRVLIETGRSRHAVAIRERLAEHVLQRLQALGETAPDQLRLVRSFWAVGSPAMAEPKGLWTTPPVTEIPSNDRHVVAEYQIKEGKLQAMPRKAPSMTIPVVAKNARSPAPKSKQVTQPPIPNSTAFVRPGVPPGITVPRSQIKRRQVQQLVAPGSRPAVRSSTPLPPSKLGGLDVSKLKLGQPGVPVQRMPSPPPPAAVKAPDASVPKAILR